MADNLLPGGQCHLHERPPLRSFFLSLSPSEPGDLRLCSPREKKSPPCETRNKQGGDTKPARRQPRSPLKRCAPRARRHVTLFALSVYTASSPHRSNNVCDVPLRILQSALVVGQLPLFLSTFLKRNFLLRRSLSLISSFQAIETKSERWILEYLYTPV